MFEVIHILYNNAKPYVSTVDIAGADVTSDVQHYYKQVEGMTTLIDLETIFHGKLLKRFLISLFMFILSRQSNCFFRWCHDTTFATAHY